MKIITRRTALGAAALLASPDIARAQPRFQRMELPRSGLARCC